MIWMFLGGPLAALLLLALANVTTSSDVRNGTKSWWDPGVAFSTDLATSLASRVLYPAGISIAPDSTVIGQSGWLFLGDRYNSGITVVRNAGKQRQERLAARVATGVSAWRDWLADRQVRQFWVLVAPDKDDIYPDNLPAWVRPVAGNSQDLVRAAIDPLTLIDAVDLLRRERPLQSDLLFKITDTHWSNLGAWLATRAFFQRAAAADNTLRFALEIEIGPTSPTQGGDLAGFLRLAEVLEDFDQQIVPIGADAPAFEHTDFNASTPVIAALGAIMAGNAVLTETTNSLNERRVLWIHDSFGTAMAGHIYDAFSDVLEVHVGRSSKEVADLVTRFKPEIVLVTVVDRQAALPLLRTGPPS